MSAIPGSSRPRSVRQLAQAPHRLLFFIGSANLLLGMLWWAAWLASAAGWLPPPPETAIPAGWLHALVMQYLVLPSFAFGFLLTVFPRWMALPETPRRNYLCVGAGLVGGHGAVLLAASGYAPAFAPGLALTLLGWTAALWTLGGQLRAESGRTWHARSCLAALLLGYAGLLCFTAAALGVAPALIHAGLALGGFGMLLPLYLSVAHRMFPFFAANAVPGYLPWRPLRWLAACWSLIILHLGLDLAALPQWLWLADLPLLGLTLIALWHWWPRTAMPGLLAVLFLSLLWLPLSFALYAMQSLSWCLDSGLALGRAPAHALFIGFFGSVLIAMVTRVTQGHSGRELRMPATAWFAFVAIQVVASLRVIAELMPEPLSWQALAASGWLLAFAPWVLRLGRIYLSPRRDGRPG